MRQPRQHEAIEYEADALAHRVSSALPITPDRRRQLVEFIRLVELWRGHGWGLRLFRSSRLIGEAQIPPVDDGMSAFGAGIERSFKRTARLFKRLRRIVLNNWDRSKVNLPLRWRRAASAAAGTRIGSPTTIAPRLYSSRPPAVPPCREMRSSRAAIASGRCRPFSACVSMRICVTISR